MKITKPRAFNLAIALANDPRGAVHDRATSRIKIEAGGRLIATNGFALIVSNDAHDADETVYLIEAGKGVPANTTSIEINYEPPTPNIKSTAIAQFHTSRKVTERIMYAEHEDAVNYPNADLVVPQIPAEPNLDEGPILDVIAAGKITEAYLGKKYAPADAAWLASEKAGIAYLAAGQTNDDTIIMMRLRLK